MQKAMQSARLVVYRRSLSSFTSIDVPMIEMKPRNGSGKLFLDTSVVVLPAMILGECRSDFEKKPWPRFVVCVLLVRLRGRLLK